jgi:predicted GNAT superfamily acetyltransferase
MDAEIQIRECVTFDELSACVNLQREVFGLPDIEISPVRHLVVSKNAGGFVLGAFAGDELVGFVLSVPAFFRDTRAFYSHMTAVKKAFQGSGIGGGLKWSQRSEALNRGVKFLKWTFEPWRARNAYFNLEKLGAVVREYHPNFYGIDYTTYSNGSEPIGLASDRLFAEWDLESEKVVTLAKGGSSNETERAAVEISVTPDWSSLVASDPIAAIAEQERLRTEFDAAFAIGMIGRGFVRDDATPRYLLYRE